MPALTPYPGEDPLAFERRRQAAAGTTTPAVYSPYAPLREQPKPWVDPAAPAWTPAAVQRALGGQQYGTTATTATWAPYTTGGSVRGGSPATTPASWGADAGPPRRLLDTAGLRYDPNFAARVPATTRPVGDRQYGRLLDSQGLKYDPKRGGGDVAYPAQHGRDEYNEGYNAGGGPGATNVAGLGTPGAGGINLNEDYRKNAAARKMAIMRRLGINPTGRGWLASYRREQVPDLFETLYATTGLDGRAQDPLAVMDDFARMYRGGDFAGQFRQRGQALMQNRDLLADMPLDEAAQFLKGTSQVAAYGMNPAIARSRLRGVEDAVAQYQANEVAAAEEGRAPEAGLFEFLFTPAGAQWARRLGLA